MKTRAVKKKLKYFIGMDVHKSTTSICVLNREGEVYDVQTLPTTELHLRQYLQSLPARKGIVMEEMDLSQWLYCILPQDVDEMIICDPYRNKSLADGPKNDRIDAKKLAELYRGGLVREVFHSTDERMAIRKLASCYRSTMNSYVRSVNQYKALLRKSPKPMKQCCELEKKVFRIHQEQMELTMRQLEFLREEIEKDTKPFKEIRYLKSVPGIGPIGSMKLLATVVDPLRFPTKHRFWSYCGLIQHRRESAGKSYGKKRPRANREMKGVFKTAIVTSLKGNGPMKQYYLTQREKGLSDPNARNAVGRRIAACVLYCWKHQKRYDPNFERNRKLEKEK